MQIAIFTLCDYAQNYGGKSIIVELLIKYLLNHFHLYIIHSVLLVELNTKRPEQKD